MEKHIKVIYALLIVGFLSITVQLWIQTKAINDLNEKMVSNDFSFYLDKIAGCFFLVGCGVDEYAVDDEHKMREIYDHHGANFRVDERCLIIGVQIMVNVVMDLLMKQSDR